MLHSRTYGVCTEPIGDSRKRIAAVSPVPISHTDALPSAPSIMGPLFQGVKEIKKTSLCVDGDEGQRSRKGNSKACLQLCRSKLLFVGKTARVLRSNVLWSREPCCSGRPRANARARPDGWRNKVSGVLRSDKKRSRLRCCLCYSEGISCERNLPFPSIGQPCPAPRFYGAGPGPTTSLVNPWVALFLRAFPAVPRPSSHGPMAPSIHHILLHLRDANGPRYCRFLQVKKLQ